jgi:hypothetical protein
MQAVKIQAVEIQGDEIQVVEIQVVEIQVVEIQVFPPARAVSGPFLEEQWRRYCEGEEG